MFGRKKIKNLEFKIERLEAYNDYYRKCTSQNTHINNALLENEKCARTEVFKRDKDGKNISLDDQRKELAEKGFRFNMELINGGELWIK